MTSELYKNKHIMDFMIIPDIKYLPPVRRRFVVWLTAQTLKILLIEQENMSDRHYIDYILIKFI